MTVPDDAAPVKTAKEYLSYTLAQLQEKVAESTTFASNLKHVHDGPHCRFKPCDREQPLTLLGTKLYVGSYTTTENDTQAVWAHIRSPGIKSLGKVNNSISYILDNKSVLKIGELKNVGLVEPFSYIETPDTEKGRDKLRYLVLYFFLEQGHTNSIEFTKRGFDSFRTVVTNIAKARAQTKDHSQQPSPTAYPSGHPKTGVTCPDTTKQAQAPTPIARSDPAVTSATQPTTTASTKRKQTPDDESVIQERPAKKSDKDPVAYYFAKFMESLQGQTNEEIGSLKAKSERLEKAVLELKQQRDSWEGDANFVKGQLQESEQGRHEAEVKLEETKKQVTTLENEKAKAVEDLELKDKTLEQEQELKKVHLGKLRSMQMELKQLRTFKKQFLSLASSVEGGGSAK